MKSATAMFALAIASLMATAHADPVDHAHMRPQDRMAQCNRDAKFKHLHGAARKSFMNHCLRADHR